MIIAENDTEHGGRRRTVGALIERLILIYEAPDAAEISGRIEFL